MIEQDLDQTIQEKIQLVIHHLKDLYKEIDGYEIDEDMEKELAEWLDDSVDDIEEFIDDLSKMEDEDDEE